MEINTLSEETNEHKNESIFSAEDFSREGYDKHIKQARNAIFGSGAILLVNVILLAFSVDASYQYLWIDFTVYGSFIVGFVLLGLWTKRKPYYAIIGALILYGLFIGLNAVIDVSTIFKGLLYKVMIISLLVKGLSDAKETQEQTKILGK